ncbi:TspO/MBR family protein [Sphingomonas faeni]|uniref:TspO/MBR family protein n=1 Tax=Sphingomonas faeni TaxID=185950 RepID=UPI0024134CE5|nr:TspO/MBR family protein [Sphingomonas faeni]
MSTSTPIHTDPSDVALTDPSRTGVSRTGLSKPVAALIVAGVLGASAVLGRRNAPDPSHPKKRRWYKRLDKPGFTPPDAVFGAVWPVLETGLAVGGYRLMRAPADPRRNAAVGLWLLNTAMVGGWTELFFRKRALETSAIAAGGMVVTGAAYVATAAKVDRPAAGLGVPFVAWLGFATVLATRISQRNDTRR